MKRLAISICFGLVSVSAFAQTSADCTLTEHLPWTKSGKETLSILAFSIGDTCKGAIVGFNIVNAEGQAVWTYSKIGNQISYFLDDGENQKSIFEKPSKDPQALMRRTLREWLNHEIKTTASLPNWPKSAQMLAPAEGDFGFYAADDLRRDEYMNDRKRNVPLFCFHSGVESTTCIIARQDDSIIEIGGESIP
jgi:hypothetical protein